MGKLKDLTGMVFGRLTVIERAGWTTPSKSGQKKITWLCKCSCGKYATVSTGSLRCGHTSSCGCYRRELPVNKALPKGKSALNALYSNYKYNAAKRGYLFELTIGMFQEITKQDCHYCSSPPSSTHRGKATISGDYTYNGIDRQDNSKGYVVGNVVACCKHCNQAKGEQSVEDFLDHIKRMYLTTNKTVV